MELRMDTRAWATLLPVVQANLNHTPVRSLEGHAPIELFTGLPPSSPLDRVVQPANGPPQELPVESLKLEEALELLRGHLRALHQDATDRKERRRLQEMAKQKGQVCNFKPDFVLWSRIDKRLRDNKLLVRWVGPFRVL
ncbi:unnamed protein product [Phytophthora lilii]|uniref:Unnamed protein product n=1 Tax=Phytophthora lilii TaxID=2077276 RepID=A0A9W6TPE7_9STRA|nr:unnamed protein product [Phytophthora lilii]